MKKYRYKIIWILIVFFMMIPKNTYALHQTGENVSSIILYRKNYESLTTAGEIHGEDILERLKEDFGYEGDLVTPLRIRTTVTITDTSKSLFTARKYSVTLGNKEMGEYTKDGLIATFGYEEPEGQENQDIEVGTSWPITIGAEVHQPDTSTDESTRPIGTSVVFYTYVIRASEIWTGNDEPADTPTTPVDIDTGSLSGDIQNTVNTVNEFANFLQNPIGNFCNFFSELFIRIFDALQNLMNKIQTIPLHTSGDDTCTYTYSQLEMDKQAGLDAQIAKEEGRDYDQDAGNRDVYTNVSGFRGEDYVTYEGQKYIYIDGYEKGFTRDTEIPVIPMDTYNLAIGDIIFADINFFTLDENNEENWLWNIVVTIMHITFYVGAAVLLTILIWHAINVVKSSLDNPEAKKEHRKGVKRFFISLLMLVGSIVIMALCIFASDMFMGDLKSNTRELPIRVNVTFSDTSNSETEQAGYSFSTNITGYLRYMAQIQDIDKYAEKTLYTFAYMVMVLLNCIAGAFMTIVRPLVIMLLSILGPIIAVLHALEIENKKMLSYQEWVKLYLIISSVQIFLAISIRIVLESSIFN